MQMVSKTFRMRNSVRDKHVPLVQFTLICRESGLSLTFGTGPETGRKKYMAHNFPFGYSGWESWVVHHLQQLSGNSGWKVNGIRLSGRSSGKFPGAAERLKR